MAEARNPVHCRPRRGTLLPALRPPVASGSAVPVRLLARNWRPDRRLPQWPQCRGRPSPRSRTTPRFRNQVALASRRPVHARAHERVSHPIPWARARTVRHGRMTDDAAAAAGSRIELVGEVIGAVAASPCPLRCRVQDTAYWPSGPLVPA